jgi:DMSO/TMAO reductase YedYZ molybdopterin-dependent catalytic subunit
MVARSPWRWGFPAGILGGLVMAALMLALRLALGVPALVEVVEDRAVPLVPVPLFSFFIDHLGSFAKQIFFAGVVIGMVLVAGLGGAIYAQVWGGDRLERAEFSGAPGVGAPWRLVPWRTLGLLTFLTWLLFGLLLLPLLGAGFFGADLRAGTPAVSLALLAALAAYAITLGLSYATLAAPSRAAAGPAAEPSRRGLTRRAALAGLGLALGAGVLGLMAALRRGATEAFVRRDVNGLTPEITANEKFYVVSKNFADPEVDVAGWKLEVSGLVEHPLALTRAELLGLPPSEQYQTLECISNPVGGDLISTAHWKGVPLRDVFARAGLKPGVTNIALFAEDGYSDSIPLAKAMEPTTLLAYEMNGAPLPTNHGSPLRLLVPGIYGEKNVKWINRIEPVNYDFLGFWQKVGWTNVGTIHTNARIDVPSDGAVLALEVTPVGGVAFAGNRGIKRVEVSVDGGKTWADAELRPALSPLTWVLWTYDWHPAKAGAYPLVVRATDGAGALETEVATDNFPDGPTGRHSITVRVLAA